MPFLTPEEMQALHVEDLIFHVVGKDESEMVLMDEVIATGTEVEHIPWFLERLRSTNGGNVFDFVQPSLVLNALTAIQSDPRTFVAQSRELATAFQGMHTGATARGVFLLLRLSAKGQPLHALIKYDHEEVLSYLTAEAGGKRSAQMSRMLNTFVKDPTALQKSCMIRLTTEGGEMAVLDRSQRRDISQYFRGFLGVRRRHTQESLTRRVVEAAKAAVTRHLGELGPEVAVNINQRIYEAVQATQGFNPEDSVPFLTAVVGPVPEGRKLPHSFKRELEKARVDHEAFDFDKLAVQRPRRRRILTQEGISISYNAQDADLIGQEERDGRTVITINSARVTEHDDEPEGRGAARGRTPGIIRPAP